MFTVFSKGKTSSTWLVERTFGQKIYAEELATHLKLMGKDVKIMRR